MSAIYAPTPSSRPSTPAPLQKQPTLKPSGHLPRTKQTKALRTVYSAAAQAFLLRDYGSTANLLEDATTAAGKNAGGKQEDWFRAIQQEEKATTTTTTTTGATRLELELKRKVDILTITFLATVHSSANSNDPSGDFTPPESISSLLSLAPRPLLTTLWHSSLTSPSSGDILPTSHAAYLHPSIAIALALAALKLNEPRLARSITEAWFGSISTDVDQFLADQVAQLDSEEEVMGQFPVDGGLGGSTLWLKKETSTKCGKALVGCWFRLLDLLVLHVLPKLGEWEAARDVVELQSRENGGWVPDARIQATLQQLEMLQRRETEVINLRIQRQRELELAKVERQKEKEREQKAKGKSAASKEADSMSARSSATSSPGKKASKLPRSSSTSPSTSPSTSKHLPPPPSTVVKRSTFSSLRTSISTFLSRSPAPTVTSAPRVTSSTSPTFLASLVPRLLRNQFKSDPIRLVGTVFLAFAVISWVRRTLVNRGGRRDGGAREVALTMLGKLLETVKMGTKVTTL